MVLGFLADAARSADAISSLSSVALSRRRCARTVFILVGPGRVSSGPQSRMRLAVREVKEYSEKCGHVNKELLEGTLTGHIWNDLSIKISNEIGMGNKP